MEKWEKILRELKRPANIRIMIGLVLFAYVWGVQNWDNSEIGSTAWWFDNLGHFLAGIGLFFVFIYLWATYSPGTFVTTKRISVSIIGIAIVVIVEGIFWEGLEGLWDSYLQPNYFQYWAYAQKSAVDTILDILITSFGAVVGAAAWLISNAIYDKKYPNEAEKKKIEAMRERAREFGKEILTMRREQKKQIFKELRHSIKKKIKQVQKIDR